jgi:FMN phosphatase YigB (HAD superfamily)
VGHRASRSWVFGTVFALLKLQRGPGAVIDPRFGIFCDLDLQRIVVFDLGHVVLPVAHHWQEAAGQAGIACRPGSDPLDRCPGFLAYQRGDISAQKYLSLLAEFLQLQSVEEAEKVHGGILQQEFDGMSHLLDELERVGVATACLSNTNDLHWQRVLDATLYPCIARLGTKLASHELRIEKPDPAIYHRANHLLQARPEQIIFFDDNAANIQSAEASGWTTLLIRHDVHPPEVMAQFLKTLGVLPAG